MQRRQISANVANAVLKDPGQVIEEDGNKVYQSVIRENGKSYLIRIFVNHHKNPNLVITVYKTSKISKRRIVIFTLDDLSTALHCLSDET